MCGCDNFAGLSFGLNALIALLTTLAIAFSVFFNTCFLTAFMLVFLSVFLTVFLIVTSRFNAARACDSDSKSSPNNDSINCSSLLFACFLTLLATRFNVRLVTATCFFVSAACFFANVRVLDAALDTAFVVVVVRSLSVRLDGKLCHVQK